MEEISQYEREKIREEERRKIMKEMTREKHASYSIHDSIKKKKKPQQMIEQDEAGREKFESQGSGLRFRLEFN